MSMVQRILLAVVLLLSPAFALAQGTDVALGIGAFDADEPVEVTADSLSVDQASGLAVFDGNVLVVQGDVRMSAGRVCVAGVLRDYMPQSSQHTTASHANGAR